MELPTPAPKNCEQEKWKAMVDSVIEFIAASRTMLYALNQRLQEGEKNQQELKKRTEDAKTKHPFYRGTHKIRKGFLSFCLFLASQWLLKIVQKMRVLHSKFSHLTLKIEISETGC